MANILAAFFSLILVACNGPLGKPIQIDDLESSGSFSNILNSKNESPQLVLLVSPTWSVCLEGARRVQSIILDTHPEVDLNVHAVWLPMLRADKRPQWNAKKVPINGPRVTHYWDGNQVIGKQYGQSFDKPGGVAWDIFFLYDEGAEMDSLFQPWVSTGRTIMGARDKLKTDFEALINTSKNV